MILQDKEQIFGFSVSALKSLAQKVYNRKVDSIEIHREFLGDMTDPIDVTIGTRNESQLKFCFFGTISGHLKMINDSSYVRINNNIGKDNQIELTNNYLAGYSGLQFIPFEYTNILFNSIRVDSNTAHSVSAVFTGVKINFQ
jgi:hypothetical protein